MSENENIINEEQPKVDVLKEDVKKKKKLKNVLFLQKISIGTVIRKNTTITRVKSVPD